MYIYDKNALPRPIAEGHEDWIELYYEAFKMAFKNVDYIKNEGWKPQLTCMPGVGIIWQWDSCFMVMITNYANGTLSALNNLDNLYRLARDDGFIGMAYRIAEEDEAYPNRINPPLLAWAEWEAYEVSGDSSRFERVAPIVEGLYKYIEKNRRRSSGLYYFEDTGSSGMDNSPRSGYFSSGLTGSDVCFVDLACQQSLTAKYLSKIYAVLGDTEKASFFKTENERINSLINKYHYSKKTGFYYDFFSRNYEHQKVKLINTKTVAAAWTLLSGAAKDERCDRTVAHFLNPDEFYTKIPFASLSTDDLNYDPSGGYWLGGVWAPANYALIRGMCENGYEKEAKKAAEDYLRGMCEVFKNPNTKSIWEAYSPEEFKPATTEDGECVRGEFVGWSGLAPITMLIENIIGIRLSAHQNRVYFTLSEMEKSGIENLVFNGGKISIESLRKGDSVELTVSAEKAFTLTVANDGKSENFSVSIGENKFTI